MAPTLLPRLGPLPKGMGPVWVTSLAWSWLLLLPATWRPWALLPGEAGHPDGPGTWNLHWLVHARGLLGMTHSRMLAWPSSEDRLAMEGFPLDALLSWPFLAVLGWPAGFTVFVWASLAFASAAMGWLAARWWRSRAAGLVAAVVYPVSNVLSYELSQGRSSQVVTAALLPLALGLMADALVREDARRGALAGVVGGLCALSYWFSSPLLVVGGAVLLVLALLEGRDPRPTLAGLVPGGLAVAGLPLAWAVTGTEGLGGVALGATDLVTSRGDTMVLMDQLALVVAPLGARAPEGPGVLRPELWALAATALVVARPRRWVAALSWAGIGAALALGPWVALNDQLALPGPFLLVLDLPLLRRWRWPDRALLLVAPGLVLLAAGGASWLSRWGRQRLAGRAPAGAAEWGPPVLLSLILAALAWMRLPQLPVPVTAWAPGPMALALSGGEGPVLVLPALAGPLRGDADALLDQLHHGRPLVNTQHFPFDSDAPASNHDSRAWPALASIYGCEMNPRRAAPQDAAALREGLRQVGLTDVWVQPEVVTEGARAAWLGCLEQVLGADSREVPGARVYTLPDP